DAARIEEVHDRREDSFVSLDARDRLERNLSPLEKLNEANPFDIPRTKSLFGIGADELERSQLLQARGRLPGGDAEFLDGQVRPVRECHRLLALVAHTRRRAPVQCWRRTSGASIP